MSLVLLGLQTILTLPYAWLNLLVYSLLGAGVYGLVLYVLKEPLLHEIMGKVLKRFSRRAAN